MSAAKPRPPGRGRMNRLPELLAPAGSPEALAAAVAGGADAVYFGGKRANARNFAKNFSDGEIAWAVALLHERGMRAYITLNVLHTDRELPEILDFAGHCQTCGADAFIVQDLGLAALLKKHFPGIELHASTQAAGHNLESAEKFSDLGFSRMVAARELDKNNLKYLIENAPLEIEMFVHGAMCVSHSGRCYMSLALGGSRSANRGSCAQPCRQKYGPGYALSLKDLCLAGHMREIIALSPAGLKIEGRMKPPEYVYNVCRVYRVCLDENRDATPGEMELLAGVFSRQGFSDGYFTRALGPQMFGVRTEEDKAKSKGNPTTVCGRFPSPFRGGSGACELPASFACEGGGPPQRWGEHPQRAKNIKINPKLCLVFDSGEKLSQVAGYIQREGILKRVYKIFVPLGDHLEIPDGLKKITGVRLPCVIFDSEREAVADALKGAGIDFALADHIGHIELAKKLGLELSGDFGLNAANSHTLAEYQKLGFRDVVIATEVNFAQIRDMGKPLNCGIYAYGKTRAMVVENDIAKKGAFLTDKTGAKFLVGGDFGSKRSVIYNSVPVYLADKKELYKNLGLFFVVLAFTDETPRQIEAVISDYAQSGGNAVPPGKFTRGYN